MESQLYPIDESPKEETKEPEPPAGEQQQQDEEGKKEETPSSSEEKVAQSGEGETGEVGVTAEKTEDSIVSAQGVCLM